MSKTKLVRVTAICTEYFHHVVEVPVDLEEERVMEYYRDNGASGEFEYNGDPEWEWGYAEEVDDASGMKSVTNLVDKFQDEDGTIYEEL